MKKIIYLFTIIISVISLHSCSDDTIEIVSQDTSYQLDAKYVFVDIPDAFKYDPSNIIYLPGQAVITLNGLNNTEHTSITGDKELKIKIKIKKPLTEDLSIRIGKDDTLLEEYNGDISSYKAYPDNTYSLSSTVLPAGETETIITLTLDNIDSFNESPGYILPLRLQLEKEKDGIKVSVNKYSLYVKLNLVIQRDNIDSSNTPIEGIEFNSNENVVFSSSKTTGLERLNDGKVSSEWYNNGSSDWIIATFSKTEKIKSIKINTSANSYRFKSCAVYVAEEEGIFEKHGDFSKSEENGNGVTTFYITFKSPVSAKQIKLDSFIRQTGSDKYSDITEITFIK